MRSSTSLTLQIRFYFNSFSKEQDYTALFCIQPFLLTQNHNAAILMNAKNQTRNFQRSRKEPQHLICEAKINSLELQPQTLQILNNELCVTHTHTLQDVALSLTVKHSVKSEEKKFRGRGKNSHITE